MLSTAPLIFIERLERGPERWNATGILANSSRDLPRQEWEAYVLGLDQAIVTCKAVEVDSLTALGGEDLEDDVGESLMAYAFNHVTIEIDRRFDDAMFRLLREERRPPIFIGPDPQMRPCRERASVRLRATCLLDFLDVQAYLSFLRDFSAYSPLPPEHRLSTVFERYGKERPPTAGIFFPFEVAGSGQSVHAVARLEEQQSNGKFDSTIFLSQDGVSIRDGTELRRVLRWQENGKEVVAEAVIGEFVA